MPAPGGPPPLGRNPGDAWVVAESGERYWGRFGAAGLLAVDPERGVLLQRRAQWSHHGGTWALPGGARHEGETAIAGALRESAEEAGVPAAAIRPRFVSVADFGVWSYATVIGDVERPFEAEISDPESLALEWVAPERIDGLALHPGFAASWPALRELLAVRPSVVVDVANVVGSVPDGWWRDRAGAAGRLLDRLVRATAGGLVGDELGLAAGTWFPEWSAVVEGQARAAVDVPGLAVVRAEGSGDLAVLDETGRRIAAGRTTAVVTSDRALAARALELGAIVRPSGWLRSIIDAA